MIAAIRARVVDHHDTLAPMTRGILGIILALLMFVCMDTIAKGLIQRYPAPEVIWARYASQTALMVLLLLPSLRRHLRTRHIKLQLVRSLFLFGATASFFTSLAFMPLAEVAAVFQIGPLIITILSAVVLREYVGPRRWTGVVVGLAGVLIIIRPGSDVFQLAAILPAFGAFCYASYQIATRFLGSAEPIWTTMLYTTGVGTLLATIALPFFWVTPTLTDALIMAGFGGFGLAGHLCLVYALGQAPASALAPFNYVSFVWASLFGLVWFAEVPDELTLIGAGIIIAAGIYVWHRERVRGTQ